MSSWITKLCPIQRSGAQLPCRPILSTRPVLMRVTASVQPVPPFLTTTAHLPSGEWHPPWPEALYASPHHIALAARLLSGGSGGLVAAGGTRGAGGRETPTGG